jgi:hypothetical protein
MWAQGRKSLQKVHILCQKRFWFRDISSPTPYASSTQGLFADIHCLRQLFQQKIGYPNTVTEAQVREQIAPFLESELELIVLKIFGLSASTGCPIRSSCIFSLVLKFQSADFVGSPCQRTYYVDGTL